MRESRRRLLLGIAGAASVLVVRLNFVFAQNPLPHPTPPHHEGVPKPGGDEDNPLAPNPTKSVLDKNQREIKASVEKLFELATNLKNEVEKTDATVFLSLAMVKKAEEIEKLAKQIKERAKG
ncbi:MAG TPA: hypothetical protein VK525_03205 [Candidatus Saccharimonadales bacterium]|nr:hypothetical protein [Candidatus Saccharimonadales bacterium]